MQEISSLRVKGNVKLLLQNYAQKIMSNSKIIIVMIALGNNCVLIKEDMFIAE